MKTAFLGKSTWTEQGHIEDLKRQAKEGNMISFLAFLPPVQKRNCDFIALSTWAGFAHSCRLTASQSVLLGTGTIQFMKQGWF